ncbi:hypothetical protein D9M68_860630 [compost metagenome]
MVDFPVPRAPISVLRLREKLTVWSSRYFSPFTVIETIRGNVSLSLGLVFSKLILESESRKACLSAAMDGREHLTQVWR